MKRMIPVVVAAVLLSGCCPLGRGDRAGLHPVGRAPSASVVGKKQVVSGDMMPPVISRPVHRVP
ncbi:MAG: hypothetical protein HN380_00220 [Victivallales bacterium]|jgi:hypothetical protein|nr:hypothetical protein [Victivallales bacterium]